MASLDWHLTRTDGVTLVELLVTSERAERVRIESRLDPVWPPRRQGIPAAGWYDTGFEGVLVADEPLVLGYASPAEPVDPPAEIVDQQPVPSTQEHQQGSFDRREDSSPFEHPKYSSKNPGNEVDPRALVRALGGVAPPRDAVPHPTPDGEQSVPSTTLPDSRHPSQSGADPTVDSSRQADTRPTASDLTEHHESPTATGSDDLVGGNDDHPVQSWFAAIAERLDEAERFAGMNDVDEARDVIAAFGGIEAVRELDAQLATDRRQLEALGERHGELQSRLAAVDVPLSTLERLA